MAKYYAVLKGGRHPWMIESGDDLPALRARMEQGEHLPYPYWVSYWTSAEVEQEMPLVALEAWARQGHHEFVERPEFPVYYDAQGREHAEF